MCENCGNKIDAGDRFNAFCFTCLVEFECPECYLFSYPIPNRCECLTDEMVELRAKEEGIRIYEGLRK